MTWQGQETRLVLHYDNGFTLLTRERSDGKRPEILWHYPYEKLHTTADDGNSLLWLDFGDDGEQVLFHHGFNIILTL